MTRSARLDAPGVLHHIIIKGIEQREIFIDDKDRDDFLARMERLLLETKTSCYAWALIPDHAHFLFRTGNIPVAVLMSRLLTGYAVGYNRRHKRNGKLFQNRYKSILCQEEIYLAELVRYIHLNPIRAGLVSNLEELNSYSYCGHSALLGNIKRDWQDSDYVLGYFGAESIDAISCYDTFVSQGIHHGHREDLVGGGLIRSLNGWSPTGIKESHLKSDERILGDGKFVEAVLSETKERFERSYLIRCRGYDLEKVAARAAAICAIEVDDIFSRRKQTTKVKARSLFCYWASSELGVSHTELAKRIGISVPGVGYCAERGKLIARQNGYQLLE